MPQKNNLLKLSILIPVFNEIKCIETFTKRLFNCFQKEQPQYIFIDDGSNDGTKEWLTKNLTSYKLSGTIKLINLSTNKGKGFALRKGLEVASGEHIMLLDSDLEYDPEDCLEMFQIIQSNTNIEALFGSRYIGGKIKHRKYLLNNIAVKINTFIFNFLFKESISDLHCGTKIISKKLFDNIKLSVNDFGFEIDLAGQIAKANKKIYQYGISYVGRTVSEGKKITWLDGLLSYYYFFKIRFIDNDIAILISIFFSSIYMGYIGSHFGMGTGKILAIISFFILGLFIGLKNKIASSSIIFLFIYLGSLFSKGNGVIFPVLIFFIIGLYISNKINLIIKNNINNKFINFFI